MGILENALDGAFFETRPENGQKSEKGQKMKTMMIIAIASLTLVACGEYSAPSTHRGVFHHEGGGGDGGGSRRESLAESQERSGQTSSGETTSGPEGTTDSGGGYGFGAISG